MTSTPAPPTNTTVSLQPAPPPDASQATPTRRRPDEGALRPIDWSPLLIGLMATWGLVLSIWPHSSMQRYAAIGFAATATLATRAIRGAAPSSVQIRLLGTAAAGIVAAGIAVSISGVTALVVWSLGLMAALAASGFALTAKWNWPIRSNAAIVALGLAEATWWRTRSLALFGACVALSLGASWATRRRSAPTAADRAVRRAVDLFASTIGLVLTSIVAIPLLYLPAAIGRLISKLRSATGAPEWTPVGADPVGHRADRSRMFVSPARGQGRRVNMAAAAAVLIAAAVTIAILAKVDRRPAPPADVYAGAPARTAPTAPPSTASASVSTQPVRSTLVPEDKERFSWTPFTERELTPYSGRPAYLNDPVGDQIQAAQGNIVLSANAVGGNRVDDFETDVFTVRNGERASLQPTCACPEVVLWFFGGSAAFGVGQRNEHTIASELVRMAEKDRIALRVHNFGSPGWTIWQEFQAFSARIGETGAEKPDLAVFYDGFNDAVGSLFEAGVHGIRPDVPTLLTNGDVWSFVETDTKIDDTELAAVKASARDKYRSVQQVIDDVATANAIDTAYFFQPDAFAAPTQERAIKDLYGPDFSIFQQLQMTEMLDSLDPALTSGPDASSFSLRHLFDDEPKTVFLDYVHTNEYAARAVAEAMYPSLRTTILEQARP